MDKPKYISSFASLPLKCIIGQETDKYLSIASLEELKAFLPEIDPRNIDLLPISFNACVVNRVNKNGDIINTDTALSVYKNFINKFIDVEHGRSKIVGTIVSASFSEFGSDKPLTEEQVKDKQFPFNITLGGIIWKAVNNDLAELIEESADPSSEHYLSCNASWELGFSDYKIIELPQGEKSLINPLEITNEEEKEKIKKYLKCFGGSGMKDGKNYYRMPFQDVIPMGIGLTEKPAAEVCGIAVQVTPNQENIQAKAVVLELNNKDSISQVNNLDVKNNRIKIMKINNIADITDENLKQCSASVISDFIQSEITKASKTYETTLAEEKNSKKTLEEKQTSLANSLKQMQDIVATLSKEKEERDGVDTFNRHMNEIFATYTLPSDVATVVATDLKDCLTDEAFSKWKARASVYLKPFAKAAISDMHGGKHEHNEIGIDKNDKKPFHKSSTESGPEDKIGTSEKQPECDLDNGHHGKASEEEAEAKMTDGPKGGGKDEKTKKKSSTTSGPEDDKKSSKHEKDTDKSEASAIATAIDNAIDNGSTEKGGLPNGTSASTPNAKQKYAQAFAEENFIIK